MLFNCPVSIVNLLLSEVLLLGFADRGALGAGTDIAQVIPGVDAMLVSVIPEETDGVLADGLGLRGPRGRLEHGQLAGILFGLFPGLAVGFGALELRSLDVG